MAARTDPRPQRRPARLSAASTGARLAFDRGSLRLEAPRSAPVPPYLTWDPRVGAWRTEAINHLRLAEDAAAYSLTIEDAAERFFACPSLRPSLPRLRSDQEAAITAWERAGGRGVIVKPTGTGKTEIALSIIARQRVSRPAAATGSSSTAPTRSFATPTPLGSTSPGSWRPSSRLGTGA